MNVANLFRERIEVAKWMDLGTNPLKPQHDDAFFLGKCYPVCLGDDTLIPEPQFKIIRTTERHFSLEVLKSCKSQVLRLSSFQKNPRGTAASLL